MREQRLYTRREYPPLIQRPGQQTLRKYNIKCHFKLRGDLKKKQMNRDC
jgi:hypothetical protein